MAVRPGKQLEVQAKADAMAAWIAAEIAAGQANRRARPSVADRLRRALGRR